MRRLGSYRLVAVLVALLLAGLAPELAGAQPAANAQPAAAEIVNSSLQAFYYPAEDGRARVSMTLINPQGKQRTRELTMLRRDFGTDGDQRYFIYFHAPADVRGMTFMVWKYPAKEDDRWIFIPSISLVRRIAANDKRSSFVGSDFTYEDISGRDVGDETHSLLRSEDLNGQPCFVIESVPVENADYAKRVSWIDRERRLPIKEEFLDAHGEVVRRFTADEVTQVGEHWTITKRTMSNLRTGHRTEVTLEDVAYDVGLNESLFTERYLRQPPRRWIR